MPGPTNLALPLPPTAPHAVGMDKITPGSEFDPLPGKPLTQRDRDALALRDVCRQAGAPVPPVAAPYNGWDRKA